ncbi:hypothetical protein R1flu_025350 [Riccia fluitans]|uniref:PPPDE domain-containing protein n=1 Tax=Riccia fluitans TaxID=41844 RepID=A0ABD1XXH9_9MARC
MPSARRILAYKGSVVTDASGQASQPIPRGAFLLCWSIDSLGERLLLVDVALVEGLFYFFIWFDSKPVPFDNIINNERCRRSVSYFEVERLAERRNLGIRLGAIATPELVSSVLKSILRKLSVFVNMSQEGEKVVLNVYDLSQGLARQLSSSLLGKVIDGIWHTGVAVYGYEYYFGGGIQMTPVGQTPYGKPLRVVELGYTQIPKEVFEDYLREITPRYTQATYNVLRHNCNNFSEEVAQFLVGSSIPQYILGLPDEILNSPMGPMLMPMIQQLETTLRHNQAPQVAHPLRTGQGLPNFSGIQVPPSVGVSIKNQSSISSQPAPPQSGISTAESAPSGAEPQLTSTAKDGENKKPAEVKDKGIAVNGKKDSTLDARATVQEEITREFMMLMASGSLRASEAAALAARRVMERYGKIGSGVATS